MLRDSKRSLAIVVRAALLLLVTMCGARRLDAQDGVARTGTIAGTVSTQNGSVRLPGAVVVLRGAADKELPQQVSDGEGRFTISDLPPGRYTLCAVLDGFQSVEASATVTAGATVTLTFDLPIASVTEHVDVVARPVVSSSDSLATTETISNTETQLLTPGRGLSIRRSPDARRHRADRRGQHRRRAAPPGQPATRPGDARRPVDQPGSGHAARRRHRVGLGDVEPVRSGVRQVLVRPRAAPDPARRRHVEGAGQQSRTKPESEALHGPERDRHRRVEAERGDRRSARQRPRVRGTDGAVSLPDDRHQQPARRPNCAPPTGSARSPASTPT